MMTPTLFKRMSRLHTKTDHVWLVDGYVVATNGYVAVAVDAAIAEAEIAEAPEARLRDAVMEWRAAPMIEILTTDTDTLLTFAGRSLLPCAACSNTRTVTCIECGGIGEISCDCARCGNEHTASCSMCDGKGTQACMACQREPYGSGRLLSAVIQTRLLATVLDVVDYTGPLCVERIDFGRERPCIRLRGAPTSSWWAVVMALIPGVATSRDFADPTTWTTPERATGLGAGDSAWMCIT